MSEASSIPSILVSKPFHWSVRQANIPETVGLLSSFILHLPWTLHNSVSRGFRIKRSVTMFKRQQNDGFVPVSGTVS